MNRFESAKFEDRNTNSSESLSGASATSSRETSSGEKHTNEQRDMLDPAELRELIHATFDTKVDRRDLQYVISGLLDGSIEPKSSITTPKRKVHNPEHGELTRTRQFDNAKEFFEENNCLDDYVVLQSTLQGAHGISLPDL